MHFPKIPDFNIEKIIAYGGFSVVFSALDLKSKTQVAIKIPLKSKYLTTNKLDQLFTSEIAICSKIKHPNIVRFLKPKTSTPSSASSNNFAVFELIPGVTLKEYIIKKGTLSLAETSQILLQILRAIIYLNKINIAHGDIKPKNIMISTNKNGIVAKLIDFGSATEISESLETVCCTEAKNVFFNGTPDYAPPYRIKGAPPTLESDIYSWSLLFLECLVGHNPKLLSKNAKYNISIPPTIGRIPIVKSLKDYLITTPFQQANRVTDIFNSLECLTQENNEIPVNKEQILTMEDTVIIFSD